MTLRTTLLESHQENPKTRTYDIKELSRASRGPAWSNEANMTPSAGQDLDALDEDLQASEKRQTQRRRRRSSASKAKSEPVEARNQRLQTVAVKPTRRTTVATRASRAREANGNLVKRTPATRKTSTASKITTPPDASSHILATTSSLIASGTSGSRQKDKMEVAVERESSPLSEHSESEFADATTAMPMPDTLSHAHQTGPQTITADKMSVSDTATTTGDVGDQTDTAQHASAQQAIKEAVASLIFGTSNSNPDTGVINTSARSHQTAQGRPKRQRKARDFFGRPADAAQFEPSLSRTFSPEIADDAEGEEAEEAPKKRRKTIAAISKASKPVKQPRASCRSDPASGRPKGSFRQSKLTSRIVKLPMSPAMQGLIESANIKLPPTPETIRKTPAKSTTRRGSKATPKAPQAPVLPPTPGSTVAAPAIPNASVYAAKLALSRRLTAREPLGSKPQPQGQPEVWAESRQALCETLPYFKRPQGGCYQNDSHVYGFLFDSVGHCREYVDEDVIICRAGGSMEQDPAGGMVQKKDQSVKEAQVLAVLNDIAHQNPLIVICGNRNGGAKCEMPHHYSVLGWYKPVAVWEEKTAGKGKKVWTTVKYRLERLNQAGDVAPWHAPAGSELSSLRATAQPASHQQCPGCGKTFDQVYLQGWMCLNSACETFWRINGISGPAGNTGLDYNPDFLLSRAPAWGNEAVPPAPVRPPIPDVGNILGDDLAYINTRGICCPKCGRCNSRRLFDRWVCENPTCDYELRPQHRPVMPTHLHTPWDVAPTLVRNKVETGINVSIEHKHGYKVCTYTFDGIDGCFIHAAATKPILAAPGGPDDMMADLQSQELGLERRVFAVTKMSGSKKATEAKPAEAAAETFLSPPAEEQTAVAATAESDEPVKEKRVFEDGDLMTAFSMNYGMPYKFVASGASRAFEDSPKAVNDCRYRLNWAARTFLGKTNKALDFNEELIFTYLEGQKIEYHDDGEDGLGPEIASLSLGGRAKMHMRMKAKHFVGCSKTGILTEEKPVPGSVDGPEMYEKRLAAWQELQALRSDPSAYNKRRKELPKELGIFEKRGKKADDLVTVTLSHGDIMVMDGYDIQRYLEHKVVPEGYLRFALTCRTVLEDHLKPEERPEYVVQPDEGRYDGSR